jgi:hypothetical protein
MDIRTALHRMNSPVLLEGQSDSALVLSVGTKQALDARERDAKGLALLPSKVPTSAVGLGAGGIEVRPIDAFLRLARVTALTVPDDVFAFYQNWSWLRYLGAFDYLQNPKRLSLDETALQSVHANQRRVLSEELGVGFGVLIAEEWCRAMGAVGAIRTTDVDKVLRESRMRPQLTQVSGSTRQADYLMQYQSPTVASADESRLLETKGTTSRSNAISQLSHATTQIASLLLGGEALQGIAISTVATTKGIKFLAIDPEGEIKPWRPSQEAINRAKTKAPSFSETNGTYELVKDEFLSSAVVTTNASLADFAGLNEVTKVWLPEDTVLQSRRNRGTGQLKRLQVGDVDFVGHEFVLPAPGSTGDLKVFQGVSRDIEEALRSGDDDRVRHSQNTFAESARSQVEASSELEAVAASEEGALLRVAYKG